ncbi:MAG: chloride channel protein [Bacteroidales bacterium]|jgi:CIC family chloride channel protein|nr:chloride channel protein [Bacteroidales bacterium]
MITETFHKILQENSKAIRAFNFLKKHDIVLLSIMVGLLAGCAAVLLKTMLHYGSEFVIDLFEPSDTNYFFIILPIIGVTLSFIYVTYILKDNISHGVSRVLYAIAKKRGNLEKSKTYSSLIASTLTIGFGGSVGPEAPIVLSGSSIGSYIGRLFKVDYRTMLLLVACGAAGAIAGIFGAPIAGIVFALEVLMIDLSLSSIVPLLIASVSGALVTALFMGRDVLFHFSMKNDFEFRNLWFYLLLGIVAGFVSLYFLKISEKAESIFARYKNPWNKILIGGGFLGILIFLFPPLYGEGFVFISYILQGQTEVLFNNTWYYPYQDNTFIFLGFILALIFLKVIAMSLTNGSGGIGGVFAPSLFVGGMLGFFVARLLNETLHLNLPEAYFALTGMAAVMSGVMHAPLTAIFLVTEISGGYRLFIPLVFVSVSAYLVNVYFHRHSVYTKTLAEKKELFTHDKDAMALSLISLSNLVEKSFTVVHPNDTLGQLVKAISCSTRNVFPIVENNNKFMGVVTLDHVKTLIFHPEYYEKIYVKELMYSPKYTIDISEKIENVVKKMSDTNDYNFAVLDKDTYLGFVSRADVFSAYRKTIKELSSDY